MGATDTRGSITDLHTKCVNRLKALYVPNTSSSHNLSNVDYTGYIDPRYGRQTSDFVAIGDSGDVQQFLILTEQEELRQLDETIGDFNQKNVSMSDLKDFFNSENTVITPSGKEKVIFLPNRIYDKYSDEFDPIIEDTGLIVWIAEISKYTAIWKESGAHTKDILNESLSMNNEGPIQLRDVNCDFCPVARRSSKEIRLLRFAERLISYSWNRQRESISLHEIDDIMVDPEKSDIFSHLPKDERSEIWNRCMWHMSHRFDLMSKSTDSLHAYNWNQTQFLNYNDRRASLLENIREELGVGESA